MNKKQKRFYLISFELRRNVYTLCVQAFVHGEELGDFNIKC